MNKRIKELAHEAGLPTYNPVGIPTKLEKFAELIVRECITVSEAHAKSIEAQPCDPEFSLYVDAIVNGIYEATAAIKEHFGVE